MSRRLMSAVLLVGLGLLAGCTASTASQQPPASQGPTSEPSTAVDAGPTEPCALLPAEQVGEQFGVRRVTAKALPERTVPNNGGKNYSCEYTADTTNTTLGALTVTTFEGNPITPAAAIDAIRANYPSAEDVDGLGDAAITYEDTRFRYLASATLVSTTPVLVMFIGSKNADVEQLTALVRPAVDQL